MVTERSADAGPVPRGRAVGVDVGKARIGLAVTDPDVLIATPVRTVRRDLKRHSCVPEVVAAALEADAVVVYVGLPMNLAGRSTASTQDAVEYAERVQRRLSAEGSSAPVRLVDERLSTVSAQRALSASGRSTRASRDVIDQAAAVAILQAAADTQRRTGAFAGDPVPTGQDGAVPSDSSPQQHPSSSARAGDPSIPRDAQEGRP